ncbi:MAG: c-type cytochrome biogenesis protein CcmI [Gammaproteobacteria bacterium]|uniref:c-type cytochrome biogenesis protein CcmI n=1 Tax=Rhodoferax sp. TaxID=50421 RepID=UPI00183ACBA4|nr:c-type cytochrome biogenesis protein CcmI [Rhodoferax sp.]MBU3900827.1 c-type cytochrome biogenesis protein CcmI [Gammaproteobacteria bacterium]MBA3060020.1 c-type cytochrome biogenesis protein CcmI [Rhodoferax sp.]MBU3996589.1 c-type cytochrome biogenesis protein CcmI [Gammaproteobacteria bacterium]MBU4079578.1 c-type cytochrome biogenesis protein CcmI [Gammaproteobacteria bacterium]MBU4112244.1 c-type cytochrome biogenesis protein CcmI [Gammaproteobacteria bacterium]
MSVFISIAVLLTLLALVWVVRPLLRPPPPAGVSSQRLNAAIYRDQLEALDRDLARGAISQEDCEATRDELQLRLLDDTEAPAPVHHTSGASFWAGRFTAAVIVLLMPIGAGGMYWWLGEPAAIDPVAAQKSNEDQAMKMVDILADRLRANPDNPTGWAMLARSYKVMGRFAEAEQAFLKAGDLLNTEPDLMVDYADLLAVRANNNIEGRPLELVNKALSLDPQHPMGLMMAGVAAYRRFDYKEAVVYWETLLTLLEPGSPDALQVATDISEARVRAGLPAAETSAPMPATNPGTQDTRAGELPPVDPAAAAAMTPEMVNQMVDRLAERLKSTPDDLTGWARLARTYKTQGRLVEAEQAYAKAGKLVDGDPDLLTQYADVLAMRADNKIEGRTLTLVNKALALDPNHPTALMMAGTAAYRRADYAQAVSHWEKVLTVLPPGSNDAAMVQSEIADARAKGGLGLQAKP